jgi:hypothetical protein
MVAGEGKSPEEQRGAREKVGSGGLWLGGWAGGLFKTRYGRTGQSTVHVRCTPDNT